MENANGKFKDHGNGNAMEMEVKWKIGSWLWKTGKQVENGNGS